MTGVSEAVDRLLPPLIAEVEELFELVELEDAVAPVEEEEDDVVESRAAINACVIGSVPVELVAEVSLVELVESLALAA